MDYIMKEIKIKELREAMELVKRVFDEFEAPYYTKRGIENFYKFANYNNIKQQLNRNMRIYVMKDKNTIIGMIAIRNNSHIALLFVDKKYHRKGIATDLLNKSISHCIQNDKYLKHITVNSSQYGIGFYHATGFKDTDVQQEKDGIIFVPMKLKI